MRSWRLDVGEVTLAVSERGDPRAPAAVVVPGVGSTGEFAARCWAGCVEAGYRLVTYDLRGHGASTPLDEPGLHALERHVADLAAVVAETGARVVGGTSLGAHIAAAFAAGHVTEASAATTARPSLDALLLAIPGWLGPGSPTALANAAVADEIEAVGVAAVLARIAADPAVPRWVVIELDRSWYLPTQPSLVAALRAVAADPAPDLVALATIGAPAGVVGVVDDPGHPFAAAEAYAAALPRAALESLSMAEWGERRSLLGDAALAACRRAIGSR